ncbi:DUF6538 domain-containing protein [Pseudidiomarina halophila]|uniref:Tyr recombinase domain-containing protein n=1 Tax=Pseudidiomarina halophila TaxID=1449799 RepID=A0A432XZ48_9GAMM|nr:site-specific integrase [Pseudidiomarina halophila]RUO54012.1 hypothetical protein CWI69_00845 [Pseudidiomarina halophila]
MGIMAQPYKHSKTGVYWIRRAVPQDIKTAYGKTEVKRSLRTKDLSEARASFPIEYDRISQEFEACRRKIERQLKLEATLEVEQDTLSLRDINILTARYYNSELLRMQQSKTLGATDMLKYDLMAVRLGEWRDTKEAAAAVLESADDSDHRCDAEPDLDAALEAEFGDVASGLISEAGYLISRDSESFKRLLVSLGRLVPRLRQAVIDLVYFTGDEPDFLNTDNMQLTQPIERTASLHEGIEKPQGVTIVQVFEDFCEATRRYNKGRDKATENTLKDYKVTVKRFAEFIGEKPVAAVTKADVFEFSDLLLTLPSRAKSDIRALPLAEQAALAKSHGMTLLSASTVKKQLMGLSSVFEYAAERELCQFNPVHGTTKRLSKSIENRSGSEKQYSVADIERIFSSPLFTDGYRPSSGAYGEAVYWLPLLAYYTGARVEELAQLHVADVRSTDNLYYIHINADADDKSVKNKGSVRRVPLHSHLIELGFIDYLNSLQDSQRVFPQLSQGSGKKYANRVSKWLSDYFRQSLGINPAIKPMHGFRHTFKTLARANGIAKDVSDTLTGHSSGDVADTYGEYQLVTLSEAIEKLPRVNLVGCSADSYSSR